MSARRQDDDDVVAGLVLDFADVGEDLGDVVWAHRARNLNEKLDGLGLYSAERWLDSLRQSNMARKGLENAIWTILGGFWVVLGLEERRAARQPKIAQKGPLKRYLDV